MDNQVTQAAPIGEEQLREFTKTLREYHAGSAGTRNRIISSENWWKLRNTTEEQKTTNINADGGFASRSAWMHNVISSKHADAMEAYPEPNILPREEADRQEAQSLTSIIPCILEQNGFEQTYSDAMWQKCKTGTGVYKIIWDKNKLGGLGDISISRVNLLNLYWEPGVTDIQRSKMFFQTELVDKEVLKGRYPQLQDKLKSNTFVSSKFLYDDSVSTEDKATVVECYYHKFDGTRKILHYVKYVEDVVLYATENEADGMAQRGLYDHGEFPYVFDALFPIEGSPCGYGYVDLCKNPQTEIDLLKTSFVKNAQVGAVPRFLSRSDGNINEQEFLDLSKPIVHVSGSVDETSLRQIGFNQLPGVYVNMLDRTIEELRETTGNTETSTGSASGVTAASAIAALQEASGKTSRDATLSAYRAYSQLIRLTIELIRQFYDLPRKFRITGEQGQQQFVTYSNQALQNQSQGSAFGLDMGYRRPEFDVKISAQKRNAYTKVAQNELALQFFQLGFFNPQMTDQALCCLEIMDFDGKEAIMQRVSRLGGMAMLLQKYMPMVLQMAMQTNPMAAQQIAMEMQSVGIVPPVPQGAPTEGRMPQGDNISGIQEKEHSVVQKARQRAANASQPGGNA